MQDINYIGWDIGGAHLKVAGVNPAGELIYVKQFATPLWQGMGQLEQAMPIAINALPQSIPRHAVTMTAELVDIFPSRTDGVRALTQLCQQFLGNDIDLYATGLGFINVNPHAEESDEIASANWYASSELVATHIDSGLFIDIGSTTTDIVPFANKKLLNLGNNDQSRMQHDELVYTGVIRTSLMALARRVPFAGHWQNIAAEHFATTADIYRILGLLDERTDLMQAADGAGKDRVASIRRLARMVGIDAGDDKDEKAWVDLARHFADLHLQELEQAVARVMSRLPQLDRIIIGAGAGRFVLRRLAEKLQFEYMEFSDLLQCNAGLEDDCNICAPAVALAQLNRLRLLS
ncbi:MAG: hydantoinase/oxoprolinase family protein [Gammaproteobacteria bacterium]